MPLKMSHEIGLRVSRTGATLEVRAGLLSKREQKVSATQANTERGRNFHLYSLASEVRLFIGQKNCAGVGRKGDFQPVDLAKR